MIRCLESFEREDDRCLESLEREDDRCLEILKGSMIGV